MNPIFRREFFARWRDWRSHLLLLVLALLLAGSAYWSYYLAMSFAPATFQMSLPSGAIATYVISPVTGRPVPFVPESLATRTARAGHALFGTLTLGNIAVLFVLAPLLTATGVVRERERGLLESLQLSHMSSRSQIVARAFSALVFLAMLQLVTLPVAFVAFSFGGVSVADIERAWLLAGATAIVGVGLGLMISSGAARPSGALFGVITLLFLWSGAACLGGAFASSPWGFLGLGPGTLTFCEVLFYSHPLALMTQLFNPLTLQAPPIMWGGPLKVRPVYWTALEVLPFALLAWTSIGALGLLKATRDVTRAFAPSGWAGRNTLVEKWKRRREERAQLQRKKASARVEGALLADLPLDKWIRFKNPLLNREVKGRFRLRRASALVWALRSAAFLAGVSAWIIAGTAVLDPVGRRGGMTSVLWSEWILGVVLVGTFAAAGFARERESGTWEGVRLSLLPDGQIARTKWASPLIAFALLSCPLWLLLFLFLPVGGWNGTPFRVAFGGALAVAGSLAVVSALASWVSLRAKNTTSATCWTLGLLIALFCVAPAAWQISGANNRIASARVGVSPLDFDGSNGMNNPEYVALYHQETGRHLHRNQPQASPVTKAGPPTVGPFLNSQSNPYNLWPEEVAGYQAWFNLKQKQFWRAREQTNWWNPVYVLGALSNTNPDSNRVLDDNDLALMALSHAALCALTVALLLWLVTRRLQKQRD
jgi:hypothetical protein